ncbi:MAG: tRNA lysidine(34) synthetase TilS [Gemmatimonadetes bacterium]|nr:tRNA lysidine(34) synthetase TilS [Gemmatimonadota bacterium]
MSVQSLEARVQSALARAGAVADDRWVVAVSGGLDSVVLLHLLRFAMRPRAGLVVAHFDHGMRPESADDAKWVAGLATAWEIEARVVRAPTVPASEADARAARYAFLEDVRRQVDASLVLTAHHADDQAETVLFRALRGTGQAGLGGMAPLRDTLFRPLLAFWREELEAYAQEQHISWREDATNASLGYARNALRHVVLPGIERLVAPGARRALVRLADLAREDEAGWDSVVTGLLPSLGIEDGAGGLWVDRPALVGLHPAVRARALRSVVARMGGSLDEVATRRAVELVADGRSGQRIDLGGGLTLALELGRVHIVAPARARADRPLAIADVGPGSGSALLAGRDVPVAWGLEGRGPGPTSASFALDRLRFPLWVRAREPGDRILLRSSGKPITKKVKKLLLEHRIPGPERRAVPLVVDAEGEVLWIPGIAPARHPPEAGSVLGIEVG